MTETKLNPGRTLLEAGCCVRLASSPPVA